MIFKVLIFFIFLTNLTNGNKVNGTITLETLSILKSSYVHMKNESAVFEKINKILSQGADKIQLITDFDKTITKQHENNTDELDSFRIFYHCKQLPASNMNRINVAHMKFRAVEFNTTIPIEQRKQFANEWYETTQKNLQDFQFDRQEIKEVVRKYGPSFRDRADELFSGLKNLNIPVTLFSAGLADVIKEQLHQKNIKYDNIKIIANHLKFNGTMLNGFQNHDKLVTPFNKHHHLKEDINTEILTSRKNIILMGDNTGDATITREIENEATVLKIGFSYNQTEKGLKIYEGTFDIVLDNDQTMNVILDVIKLL